jgi:hypothetical protein
MRRAKRLNHRAFQLARIVATGLLLLVLCGRRWSR